MKKYFVITVFIVATLFLSACGPKAADTIKIANLSPLTGPVPTFGESTKNGFMFAVNEWNAAGGVLGKQIEPIVEDSQCTPDPAVNAGNKVMDQDGVHYIVGEVCSSASLPVAINAEENGVLMISPTSTNEGVTLTADGATKQFVFRACFIDAFQGFVMAKFATDEGYKTAFIMLDQGNDYVRGLAEEFEKHFTSMGGTVVGKESYTDTDTDFSAILAKVADSEAEVLYLPDYYNIVNLVGAQAKEKGVTAKMMGGDGWDSADLDRAAADGGFYSNHYSPEDTRPIVQDWVAKYTEEFGAAPDALATLAYDATNLLIAAIEAAGVDDAAAVAKAMEGLSYEAVSGTVTFDDRHNPIKGAVVLGVNDGNIDFVAAVAP